MSKIAVEVGSSKISPPRVKILYSPETHPRKAPIRWSEHRDVESEQKALQKKDANFDIIQRMVKNGLDWSSHSFVIHGRVKDIAPSARMANNPGANLNSALIELTPLFAPLVQRSEAFKEYHDTTDDQQGKATASSLIASGKARFNPLDVVFCPEEVMLVCDGETISAYRLTSFTFEYASHVAKQYYAASGRAIIDAQSYCRRQDKVSPCVRYSSGTTNATNNDGRSQRSALRISVAESVSETEVEQPQPEVQSLTDEQCITSPYAKGMDLRNKEWCTLRVEDLSGIGWHSHVFSSLVLQEGDKEAARSMVKQENAANVEADFLESKAAEECRVPLYSMSASDLGTSLEKVDVALTGAFECCARWNAILLVDEADMFLSERILEGLHRNGLVPILLRRLDHYQGILFLATNRIAVIDPAFESRIDMIIRYRDLTIQACNVVWANLPHNGGVGRFDVLAIELPILAEAQANGRGIKNLVKNPPIMNGWQSGFWRPHDAGGYAFQSTKTIKRLRSLGC
ncbi:hypothetical protein DL769_009224 [Monosporascus sp. CRB-8-3]|nr:hypothetical protein DL769_009224 [Monosporascus sp. CRB-8-3]